MRRAATRAFIGEHQNISNKNATLRKINSNNRLPSNYTEHIEVYSNDTKPSLWRKPLGQIGPVIKLKVWKIYIQVIHLIEHPCIFGMNRLRTPKLEFSKR